MKLKSIIILLFILIISNLPNEVRAEDPHRNLIFILIDDLGWKDLQCYGSDFYETPSIDSLAASGVLFTNAYSANPLCSPTRASILTGQTPGRLRFTSASGHIADEILNPIATNTAASYRKNGGVQSRTRLPLEYVTFAEELKTYGYSTAFMGKWHVGRAPYIPENQGFDVVVGGREHAGPPGPGNYFAPWNVSNFPVVPDGTHIAEMLTDEAISYVNTVKNKPFMLCLWYYDVHAPFQAKEEIISEYEKKLGSDHIQRSPTMAAMIETMDTNVGRVLNYLKEEKLDTNTIIIFSSDNGGNSYSMTDETIPTNNKPLRSGKGNNYEGGVRVPMIVRAPGVTQANKVSDVITSSVDHYTSILELLNIPFPEGRITDGQSYVPALKGEDYERDPMFSVFMHDVPATNNRFNTSVRKGPWKLYKFYHDGPRREHRYELYNLDSDISETNNLADDNIYKTKELAALIDAYSDDADLLIPQPNINYEGNSMDSWYSSWETPLSIDRSAIILESSNSEPYIETSYVPNFENTTLKLEFEMKSNSGGQGKVLWKTTTHPGFSEQVSFTPSHNNEWNSYAIDFDIKGRITGLRIQPSSNTGVVAIRNIKILTEDGYWLRDFPIDGKGIIEGISETDVPNPCQPTLSWDFDNELQCWNLQNHLEGAFVDGLLNLTITGGDPYIMAPSYINFDASKYIKFVVKMKNNSSYTKGNVYFTTAHNPSFVGQFVTFDVVPNDSIVREYVIDMNVHEKWNGTVTNLRLDPVNQGVASTSVELDFIGVKESSYTQIKVYESQNNLINIYPNPTHSFLNIDFPDGINYVNCDVTIFDLNGNQIFKRQFNGKSYELDVRRLEIGLYLLEINYGKEVYKKRFIKQ